jgi:hypothetical protein
LRLCRTQGFAADGCIFAFSLTIFILTDYSHGSPDRPQKTLEKQGIDQFGKPWAIAVCSNSELLRQNHSHDSTVTTAGQEWTNVLNSSFALTVESFEL